MLRPRARFPPENAAGKRCPGAFAVLETLAGELNATGHSTLSSPGRLALNIAYPFSLPPPLPFPPLSHH
eukprot:scaffold2183_cov140-Isochrysis_galbana.AAC.1